MRINENIVFAKSILKKQNILPDSEEYKDYQKIRDMVGTDNGYVGILTKLRFVDNLDDFDELKSIYDVLKNSNIDIGKMLKLSYIDILDQFYDKLSGTKEKDDDIELYYSDDNYSYYKVKTYKGILKIGSPSWCLKTKKNWDDYQSKYPDQWVVVDNRYKRRIISPDDNYLSDYSNNKKTWIRYGISVKIKDDVVSWVANDDANLNCECTPDNYTFYGVFCTLLNLLRGDKKSYYEDFYGCDIVISEQKSGLHKVVNKSKFCGRLGIHESHLKNYDDIYVFLSKSYSSIPVIILINAAVPMGFYPSKYLKYDLHWTDISGEVFKKIFEQYAKSVIGGTHHDLFVGINLQLGEITEDEIKNLQDYKMKVGQWFVFDHSEDFFKIVNSSPGKSYQIPSKTLVTENWEMDNPLYWYINKKTLQPHKVEGDYIKEVLEAVQDLMKPKKDVEVEKDVKVSGFWDWFKKN